MMKFKITQTTITEMKIMMNCLQKMKIKNRDVNMRNIKIM